MKKLCSLVCVAGIISIASSQMNLSIADAKRFLMEQYKIIQENQIKHQNQLEALDCELEKIGL